MWVLAWLFGLGLLTLFFDKQLAQQFNPNSEPQSYQQGANVEVKLKRNRQGHYVASGLINQQPVVFLLDTGATQVSVPIHLAERLNLQPGATQRVMTANGSINVARTHIDSLQLGDLTLYDIDAHLNPGMQSDAILLGMSALKQLDFRQSGEWLYLTPNSRYQN
ncbi:TIGR02281 family clan AA aspartic protease [Lacimicrobium sp. SS2-24]|uniref:retropepsin-like aspartic protease family protein n=1 Tax=Lacimicrobium sp. SS2-24 TaxID=2005569 RepID=UPI000B4B7BDA|nr:TIGR02281 family clan AA aspartic protease [Lacimicrobium sp. SS2-24]